MTKEEAKELIDRMDTTGILDPRAYGLGLDDSQLKVNFMDRYTAQAQWITDTYAALMSYWNSSASDALKSTKTK